MPAVSTRWLLALVGAAAYVAVSLLFGGDAQAQKEEKAEKKAVKAEKKGPTDAKPIYYGVTACSGQGGAEGCHSYKQPLKVDGKAPLVCRSDEVTRWLDKDKHADAYHVINTKAAKDDKHFKKAERARKMEAILASSRKKGYKVADDPACLACHAVSPSQVPRDESFQLAEGVSCVVCHGAYDTWVGMHANPIVGQRKKFIALARSEKESKYGMTDLWDPVKRARLCASCHIGNADENKVVTHEMYAAGHPPLPGFEASNFSNQMPRHWTYIREKPAAITKMLKLDATDYEQTKLVLVGAAVSLAEAMNVLATEAAKCKDAKDDDGKALDLTHFDCYACHHDLKQSGWRRERGYPGKPGRVPMKAWPFELVSLGIEAAAASPAEEENMRTVFDRGRRDLEKAFYARPYGEVEDIAKHAAEMRTIANKLADALNKVKFTKDKVEKLFPALLKLATQPAKGKAAILDYDSARQVGWAFDVMYNELHPPGDKDTGKAGVRAVQKDMEKTLRLRLPQGRAKLIEDDLADNLKALNDYEPKGFQKLLGDLKKALK